MQKEMKINYHGIDVSDFLNKFKLLVVEGYEMTGKSTLIRDCLSKLFKTYSYYPNYEVLTTDICPHDYRYLLGMTYLENSDMLNELGEKSKVVIDRGIISALVYSEYYDQDSGLHKNEKFINYLKSLNNDKTLYIHMCHINLDFMRLLFNNANIGSNHSDEYDDKDFSEYLDKYNKFDELFRKWYDILGVNYIFIDCKTYEVVDGSDCIVLESTCDKCVCAKSIRSSNYSKGIRTICSVLDKDVTQSAFGHNSPKICPRRGNTVARR